MNLADDLLTRAEGARPRLARRASFLALGTAMALALVGCASGSNEPAPTASPEEPVVVELEPVKIAVPVLAWSAPVWVADELGFFEANGIAYEAGGLAPDTPAQVALITSGQADISGGGPAGLLQAAAGGVQTKMFASLHVFTKDPAKNTSQVLVVPGSDIKSLADLSGKKVAISNATSFLSASLLKGIDEAGGDSSTVELVQTPVDATVALLTSGQVDAAHVIEPFLTRAVKENGLVSVGPANEALAGLPGAVLFSTPEWVDSHGETIEKVLKALGEAIDYMNDPANRAEVDGIISAYTKLDLELVAEMNPFEFQLVELGEKNLVPYLDLLVDYGVMTAEQTSKVDIPSLLH